MTIVKKIICYSHFKAKNINTKDFWSLNKSIQNEINSKDLKFLKKYTKFYIVKYLELYDKSNH